MLWFGVTPIIGQTAGLPSVTDWLTAIGTLGTFLIAGIAACVALGQLREARNLREAEAQPFVTVDVEPSVVSRHLFNLIISNTGKTLARDVSIKFDPPLRSTLDSTGFSLADFKALASGIPALPPGRKYQVLLDSAIERFHSDLPDTYTVTVDFRDRNGKKAYSLTYQLDLAIYRSALYVQEQGIHHIADEMKDLNKKLGQLTSVMVEYFKKIDETNSPKRKRRFTSRFLYSGSSLPPNNEVGRGRR